MKKAFFFTFISFALACNSKQSESPKTENTATDKTVIQDTKTTEQTSNTAKPSTNATNTKNEQPTKDVKYYYKKYADVDSEDPAIGVGPRKIINEDIAQGIISYENVNNKETSKIQVWNKNGYDIVDFPGGFLLVIGNKEIDLEANTEAIELVTQIGEQRSARGGECTYNQSPVFNVSEKVEIILTCSDNPNYKEVVGYVNIQNGKPVITKK